MLSMVRHEGMKVNLPSAVTSEPEQHQFVSIAITQSNQLFINKRAINWHAIQSELELLKQSNQTELVIYISADKKSEFDFFVQLMDALKAKGITNVTIEISDTE
jgi:biopolymer transport protein ExbD